MSKLLRLLAPLAVLAVVCFGLAACGGGGSSSSSSSESTNESAETSEGSEETEASEEPEGSEAGLPTEPVAKLKPRKVGYIVFAEAAPAEARAANAAVAAGKALGWDVKVRDAGGSPEKVAASIQAFASEKAEALMIASIGVEGNLRAAEQLKNAGAPIIVVAGEIPKNPIYNAQFSENEYEMGKILAEKIVEDYPEGAKIGDLTLSVSPATKTREKALQTVVGESENAEVAASSPFDLEDPVVSTQEAVSNMLLAHPDINAIWSVTDLNTTPAVAALETKRSEAKVYSYFSDPATMEEMHAGKAVGGVVDLNLAVTSLTAMDQLVNFFEKGEPIDPNALTTEALEYKIVDPENMPPEGEEIYPLAQTLQPFSEKWAKEYPLK
jgi:ABC-type sugar transport system substrate-binding protein